RTDLAGPPVAANVDAVRIQIAHQALEQRIDDVFSFDQPSLAGRDQAKQKQPSDNQQFAELHYGITFRPAATLRVLPVRLKTISTFSQRPSQRAMHVGAARWCYSGKSGISR